MGVSNKLLYSLPYTEKRVSSSSLSVFLLSTAKIRRVEKKTDVLSELLND
jgi:hypothetical protein